MLDGAMVRQRLRTGWWAALFALILAVFAVAPTAEAALCGGETACSQAAAADRSAHDSADQGDRGHGICSHGHCHHGGSASGAGEESDAPPHIDLVHDWLSDYPSLSRVPNGLERPPRI